MVERFGSMAEVMDRNALTGRHFFEPDTLRFFDSRIGGTLYGGRYFITSERQSQGCLAHPYPRLYTIREAQYDGSIDTVGEFQAFSTRKRAEATIRALLGEE